MVANGAGGLYYIGLNYACIESVVRTFKRIKTAKRETLFLDLRTIERAALSILNKEKE